jgi:hypothetical protein
MDQWQQDLIDLDRTLWQWSEDQRIADIHRFFRGQEGTLERTIAEVEDAIHQAAWAEACEEADRAMHVRGVSCVHCRNVWLICDGHEGPCPECFGQPPDDPDEPWNEN